MSIARHHAEWLSLIEISGPFLSIPVLMRAFPQGLEPHEPETAAELRSAYEEWRDDVESLRPNPAIHTAWIDYVLHTALGWAANDLASGPAIPESIKLTALEHAETIRPDDALIDPRTNTPRILIQRYPPAQDLEKPIASSHWAASPAARMMELLHATNVTLGLLTNGEAWMLVYAPVGGTTGYITWYAALWVEEKLTLQAFRSLLSAYRMFGVPDAETLDALLQESAQDQQEVTDQLGGQVRRAVEILIRALDRADQDHESRLLSALRPDELYEAALTIMMRLVFLLNAEERKLLLLGDELYDGAYAVSTLGGQLREMADRSGEEILERRYDAWSRLLATFRAVFGGIHHDRLTLRAYGGSLFDPDRYPFLEGRAEGSSWLNVPARPLPIDNRTVLHLLEALQWLQVLVGRGLGREARRLSFRALDIEQIGHVYEGLLDHVARRADQVMLGLIGGKGLDPIMPLAGLEDAIARGEEAAIAYLKDETGRTESALRKALTSPGKLDTNKLLAACGNDVALYGRILPYAALLRVDDFDAPVVMLPGSLYIAAGQTRRATGTHYTPRSLTEPIVQHTLEPLVYQGVAEGLPREAWTLRHPSELLSLKICDMAMGSGAFLVQACRYLAERLVEAWANDQQEEPEVPPAVREFYPGSKYLIYHLPTDPSERLVFARRLIADRCLYGVDKNPLAVEMAKLSLWLITLDKDRPFTFLDHAFKAGDSLVGVSVEQLGRWALHKEDARNVLFAFDLQKRLTSAIEARRALESRPVMELADLEEKAYLLAQANAQLNDLRVSADLLILSYLNDLPNSEQEALRFDLLDAAQLGRDVPEKWSEHVSLHGLTPFHWELEFPEVFQRENAPGFDAFVGNPPFISGKRISTQFGSAYLDYLKRRWNHTRGSADLSAYFFLRGYEHLRRGGTFGLIATNTIAQGDTRTMGLEHIVNGGGVIYQATNNQPWPGAAAVVVNVVHIVKGSYGGKLCLDNHIVKTITPLLDDAANIAKPFALIANANKSFNGSFVLGMGFVLTSDHADALILHDPRNRDVLFPYLNGEDLNQRPDQSPSRWVINFFDWTLEQAEQYPDCMAIVREEVKPERTRLNDQGEYQLRSPLPHKWWIYADKRPALYHAIAPLKWVLVCSQVTKYLAFALVPNGTVYSLNLNVFAFDNVNGVFVILQSDLHESWGRKYSSTLETRLKYSNENAFETFPFPQNLTSLESIGEEYHETRRAIMLDRWEGLTDTYNRLHSAKETSDDIAGLRALHVEMDHAVAAAYGWGDLDLGHGFHETPQGVRFTVNAAARRELLARLLRFNHERHAEEVAAGLHEKGKSKRAKKPSPPAPLPHGEGSPDTAGADQLDLLPDNPPSQKRLM